MESNLMKMREAVVALLDALESLGCDEQTAALAAFVPGMADSSANCLAAFRNAKEALSAPPRNCDLVNSFDEAEEKFGSYCVQYETCRECPLHDPKECRARWLLATAISTSTD